MVELSKRLIVIVLFQNALKCCSVLSISTDLENEKIIAHHKELKNWVQTEFDPCKNFIDYAAGQVTMSTIDSVMTDKVTQDWLKSTEETNLNPVEIKARQFLESCFKHEFSKTTENERFANWPVIEIDWKISKMWTSYLGGEASLSIISTKINEENILISYGITSVKDFLLEVMYEEEQTKIQTTMVRKGIDEETANELIAEMVETSEKINKAMRDCPRNEDWYVQMKLEELKAKFPTINWENILNENNRIGNEINDENYIIIIDQMCTMDYLKAVTENIRGSYNYLFWIVVNERARQRCLRRTFEYFHEVFFTNFANKHLDSYDLKRYENIVDIVVETLKDNMIKGTLNVTDSDVEIFLEKQKTILTYMALELDMNIINNKFTNANIDSNNYERNVKNLELLMNLTSRYPCDISFAQCMTVEEFDNVITSIANQHNKPFYTAFSNQFVYIWRMVAGGGISNLFSVDKINKIENCYARVRHNNSAVFWRFHDPVDTIIVSSALKHSFEAYKKYIANENTLNLDGSFGKIGISSGKAFFVHFARDFCTKDLHEQTLLNEIVMNMNDFANEFSCEVGTAMNPKEENCFKV